MTDQSAVEWLLDWMGQNQYFIGDDLLDAVYQAMQLEEEQLKARFDEGYEEGFNNGLNKKYEIQKDIPTHLNAQLKITSVQVPHRDEFSETVGFVIEGPNKRVLFIPDIDKWEKWEKKIEEEINAKGL